jgi:hypothetical protein
MEKNLKRVEAGSEEISGSVKKASKMKGTLVNRTQKKSLGYVWRKMCVIGLRLKWVGFWAGPITHSGF